MSGAVQTVAPVTFDYRWWATRYPELAEWCSPGQAEGYFYGATRFCANPDGAPPPPDFCDLWLLLGAMGFAPTVGVIQDIAKRQYLLGLLTAHIAALNASIGGEAPSGLVGRISNASEGSISVGVAYPDSPGAEWFNQTRYGAMFWQMTKQYHGAQYFPGPGATFGRWPFGRVI